MTAPFQGNPNKTITAISVVGGIVCSRTSGQTPCFIQVSASAITATGTSNPYEDLEYNWDFGDAVLGVETFDQPLNTDLTKYVATSINANTGQWGPEAAYVYRTEGVYTVTLYIRGKNGGAFTSANTTQDITVTAFDASGGEYWFDSVSGLDANNGTSSSTPKQTITAINAAIAANRAIHLRWGSNWSGTDGILITGSNVSPLRIDAYDIGGAVVGASLYFGQLFGNNFLGGFFGAGSGSAGGNPKVTITSGTSKALTIQNGSSGTPRAKADIVISNVDFDISGTCTSASTVDWNATGNATATVTDVYFDGCAVSSQLNISGGHCILHNFLGNNNLHARAGLWNCSITTPLVASLGNRQSFYGGARDWMFFVGLSVTGAGSNITLDHHIYPNTKTHALYRYITFGSGDGKNYCVNMNYDGGASLEYAEFMLLSDCYLSGVLRGHDLGNASNSPALTLYRNIVVQRNAFTGLTGDATNIFSCGESYTLRDNLVWNCEGGRFHAPSSGLAAILTDHLYRNRVYRTSGNNAIFSYVGTYTHAKDMTDNQVWDTRAIAQAVDFSFTTQTALSSVIDRNLWYAPSDSDAKYLYNATVASTFSQWQAAGFDASGSISSPGWGDPANGDFTQPPPPVAVADNFGTTPFETPVNFDVKSNDVGTSLNVTVATVTGGAGVGTVVVEANDTLTVTPATAFSGNIAGTYTVTDGVTPQVGDWNGTVLDEEEQFPEVLTFGAVTTTTKLGAAVSFDALANSFDPLSREITLTSVAVPGEQGNVTKSAGIVTYYPAPGFIGDAVLTCVIAAGGDSDSGPATVTVKKAVRVRL